MRFVLYSLCVLIVLLASILFVSGYDGTQIREFLLGVAAIIVVASRIIKPRQDNDDDKQRLEDNETLRKQRLTVGNNASDQDAESRESSDTSQTR